WIGTTHVGGSDQHARAKPLQSGPLPLQFPEARQVPRAAAPLLAAVRIRFRLVLANFRTRSKLLGRFAGLPERVCAFFPESNHALHFWIATVCRGLSDARIGLRATVIENPHREALRSVRSLNSQIAVRAVLDRVPVVRKCLFSFFFLWPIGAWKRSYIQFFKHQARILIACVHG